MLSEAQQMTKIEWRGKSSEYILKIYFTRENLSFCSSLSVCLQFLCVCNLSLIQYKLSTLKKGNFLQGVLKLLLQANLPVSNTAEKHE